MAQQQSHSNPQNPEKHAPNKEPGSPDQRRAEPGREPYRQPSEQRPERDMPKRAGRPDEDADE
ncbi:MAG TPA: hypothetical protein VMJ74_08540 [Pseudomonadales bacterium]|nr:hypothetical protein [Pseudomonadales bacterium]